MTLSWAEFLGDREDAPAAEEEKRRGWLGRLRESLASSRQALTRELLFDPGDEESWERIEEALIAADCGVGATVEIVRRLEEREPASRAELMEGLEEVVSELVTADGQDRLALGGPPTVVLVVGVNGTGKTTTIGKLAHRLGESGRSVVLAAADTFRAAAEEQLEIWAGRSGADFVGSQRGADPAAVAFDAIAAAEARGRDVVVVDTAGRLHTQTNLMEELAKVRRVIEGRLEGAPHETLLVLDATTGQNGVRQAKLFDDAVFGIGALGVMLRRSPLIVLLSLEIMLNAANLTLIAFARQQGDLDGQIFALAVMAVAAAEVAIGLGLIVAMARRRMLLDVDQASALRG